MAYEVAGLAILLFLISLIRYLTRTDVPKIKGLPQIPGGIPLFGNLLQLGDCHPRVARGWAEKYGWPVFQTRLGDRVSPETSSHCC